MYYYCKCLIAGIFGHFFRFQYVYYCGDNTSVFSQVFPLLLLSLIAASVGRSDSFCFFQFFFFFPGVFCYRCQWLLCDWDSICRCFQYLFPLIILIEYYSTYCGCRCVVGVRLQHVLILLWCEITSCTNIAAASSSCCIPVYCLLPLPVC